MKNKIHIFNLGLIFILSFIALRSLVSVPFYTSHDGFTHTARIAAYDSALNDGQIPPRWAKNFNNQFGSPIFVYSYPLVYALGAGIHAIGINYESSFRAVMAIGFLLSGVGAYFWLSRKFGSIAGLVGSIFYLFAPYHLLNVYVRGALAENFAYGFLPFVFWSIEEIYRSTKTKFWTLFLIFSLSGLLLSHNLVSAISLPILICWSVIQAVKSKNQDLVIANIVGLLTPFLLSAFIYIPDLFERSFIRFDQGISYYFDHFVAFWQLIRSPWGYGFDLAGTLHDAMSFQLGLGHLAMMLILLSVIFFKGIKKNFEIVFFLALFIILLVLIVQHPYSRIIWETLPAVKIIVDFPWRLLGLITVITAYLASFLVAQFQKKFLVAIFLISLVLIANRNHLRVNEGVSFGDTVFETYTGTSTAGSNEYNPVWNTGKTALPNPSKIKWNNKASGLDFKIDQNNYSEIQVDRFYFPDTLIYESGKLLTKGDDWSVMETGLVRLNVPPVGGDYRLVFKDTPIRDFANKISLTTFIVLLILIWL